VCQKLTVNLLHIKGQVKDSDVLIALKPYIYFTDLSKEPANYSLIRFRIHLCNRKSQTAWHKFGNNRDFNCKGEPVCSVERLPGPSVFP